MVCFKSIDGNSCLNRFTTRTDYVTDSGVVDMGAHYMMNTPTPTPWSGVHLTLPDSPFTAGDRFDLRAKFRTNQTDTIVDMYVLLDAYGEYWFWPHWNSILESRQYVLPANDTQNIFILKFEWPEGDFGTAESFVFISAIFHADTFDLIGEFGSVEFGYE